MESAVHKANFGVGEKTVLQNKGTGKKGAHFAASVEFFTVKCDDKEFKIIGKVQPSSEHTRKMMHSDIQFATEVLMYKEILPLFGVTDLFPFMYYGQANGNPEKDVILLEDLGPCGYKVSDERLFLDIDHLRLAIKWLGKFHAASFTAKTFKRKAFDDLVSQLKFDRCGDDDDSMVEQCMARGFKPLMDKHSDILEEALEILKNDKIFNLITTPSEPWAVVCHGDFCRNNMLFKYDNDKPISVKPIDLQTSKYSSPAIDLSFFLYLNTDKNTRDLYWDSLLNEYLNSLKSNLPPEITIDEQSFFQDFACRALYGYYHCSFFTPMMSVENPPSVEDYFVQTQEQRIETMVNMGGEKATEIISSIVEHLLEKGYIHAFLNFIKNNKK